MAVSLQDLANQTGMMIYSYRMEDMTVESSTKFLCVGDFLNGKKIIELMGAFVPQSKRQL